MTICLALGAPGGDARAQESKSKPKNKDAKPSTKPTIVDETDSFQPGDVIATEDGRFHLTSVEGKFSFTFPSGFCMPKQSNQKTATPFGDLDLSLHVAADAEGSVVFAYTKFKQPIDGSFAPLMLEENAKDCPLNLTENLSAKRIFKRMEASDEPFISTPSKVRSPFMEEPMFFDRKPSPSNSFSWNGP